MKRKRLLDWIWHALRRSFLIWLCCSLLVGMVVGVGLDFQRLCRGLLVQSLIGTGSMRDGKLRALLYLSGFRDHPPAIDLFSPRSEYRARWAPLSWRRRALSCYVAAPVRPDMGWSECSTLGYNFLFDEEGRLLLSGYDDAVYGMCDINLDAVYERVVYSSHSPEAMRRAEPGDQFDHKLEVYCFGDQGAKCVFRAQYAMFGEWSPTREQAGSVGPRFGSTSEWAYPTVSLELRHRDREETLAEFSWDPKTSRLSGPLGGSGHRWRVDFSRPLPAAWGVRTAPAVVLPRFLIYGLAVSVVLIAFGWVLRRREHGSQGRLSVRTRLAAIAGILGAVALILSVLVGVCLRPRVVKGKAMALDCVLLPAGRAELIEETDRALQTEELLARLRAACDDVELAATWNAKSTFVQAFVRPDGKVQVTFCLPVYCVRDFSLRDLSVRYTVGGASPLAREVEEKNGRAVRGVAEALSKFVESP